MLFGQSYPTPGKCHFMAPAVWFAVFAIACAAGEVDEPSAASPKNIILMIGDGFGFNQMEAGRCYQYGESGGPVYLEFDQYSMSTFPADSPGYDPSQAWSDFTHLRAGDTDSAAAATALACGVKTKNGTVGKDAEGNSVPNATEKAEAAGRSTGVVTSVMFSNATPACFVAHAPKRGHVDQIAQEMLHHSSVDVIMGGGHPHYDADAVLQATPESFSNVGGAKTWEGLKAGTVGADADGDGVADPWKLIDRRAEFQELMSGPTPKRILGVAPTKSTLQLERSGDPLAPAFSVPISPDIPTLSEMTVGALNVLDDDPDGLFLMVEGGAIDWAGHANVSGRLIEEVVAFNEAIDAVVDWIDSHGGWGENLLIITADHETGQLTGPGSDPEYKPIVCNGKGNMPGMEWNIKDHTNALVPFFVKGPGAERFKQLADQSDPVRGPYLDNTELGQSLLDLAGKPWAKPD